MRHVPFLRSFWAGVAAGVPSLAFGIWLFDVTPADYFKVAILVGFTQIVAQIADAICPHHNRRLKR